MRLATPETVSVSIHTDDIIDDAVDSVFSDPGASHKLATLPLAWLKS